MPSASGKIEKQMSTETNDPVKQVVSIVEKKVRNLEKRKGKLDAYRQDSQNGKELNEDQKKAVEKYDQVLELLEFAKDLQKQFTSVIQDSSKAQKKVAKREQLERQQQELQRIKEIMVYQDLLNSMGGEDVRQDFLAGNKGAVKLSEEELNSLDELYKAICPERDADSFEVVSESEGQLDFDNLLTAAAEHVQGLLDAKNKEAFGTTYKGLKETLQKIHSCSYFSKSNQSESLGSEEKEVTKTPEPECQHIQPEVNTSPEVEDFVMVQKNSPQPERPFYPVENSSLYTEQPRPIQEVLSAQNSNLNFLQESQIELESSCQDAHPTLGPSFAPYPTRSSEEPSTQPPGADHIATQTFTNQSFPSATAIHPLMAAQGYGMLAQQQQQHRGVSLAATALGPNGIAMTTGHQHQNLGPSNIAVAPLSVGGLAATTSPALSSQQADIYSLCLKMNQISTETTQPSLVSTAQYDMNDLHDSAMPKHTTSTYGNGGESLSESRSRTGSNAFSRAPTQVEYGSDRAYQMSNNSQVYMNRDNYGDNSSYSSNLKRGLTSRGGARGTSAPRGASSSRGGRVPYRN